MNRPFPKPLMILLGILGFLVAVFLGIALGWFLPTPFAQTATPANLPIGLLPSPQPAVPSTVKSAAPSSGQTQSTPQPTATLPPANALEGLRQQGVIILSMSDGSHNHLFAYHPQYLVMARLTDSDWDDISPAVSPDGSQVAFASHQNGYWDIYLLDLATGKQSRVTDTPAYDGAPTWSPDGQFLAYESYTETGTQIFIRKVTDLSQPPVQLTSEPGQSFAPAWSPLGREIAFVSTRSGQEDIWLARLDRIDDRFINISASGSGTGRDRSPRWSPDGNSLAWSTDTPGTSVLLTWDERTPEKLPRQVANGDLPVWSPKGDALLAEIREPNRTSLAIYRLSDGAFVYPPNPVSGHLEGMDWRGSPVPDKIASYPFPPNPQSPGPQLYQPVVTVKSGLQKDRYALVPLKDVTVPYPYLQDSVDESFQALRQ